jgi:hypothetical protein
MLRVARFATASGMVMWAGHRKPLLSPMGGFVALPGTAMALFNFTGIWIIVTCDMGETGQDIWDT